MGSSQQIGQHADQLTRRVVDVCDRLGDFIEWWGFRGIDGRVWALLAVHAEPMSQVEVARLLDVSRSLVHSAMQELESYGLVERVGTGRLAPWTANIEVWPVITNILRSREWMMLEEIRMSLGAAIELAEQQGETNKPGWSVQRLYRLLALTEVAQEFLGIILSLRGTGPRTGVRDALKRAGQVVQHLRQAFSNES